MENIIGFEFKFVFWTFECISNRFRLSAAGGLYCTYDSWWCAAAGIRRAPDKWPISHANNMHDAYEPIHLYLVMESVSDVLRWHECTTKLIRVNGRCGSTCRGTHPAYFVRLKYNFKQTFAWLDVTYGVEWRLIVFENKSSSVRNQNTLLSQCWSSGKMEKRKRKMIWFDLGLL